MGDARRRDVRPADALRAARGKLLNVRRHLLRGWVIPAHPLALTARRKLDEKRQAALTRYYIDAGAGGIAVGVHTTQFAIREPRHGLLQPVLALAADTARAWRGDNGVALIAGVVGRTPQALAEAELARSLGYHAGLVSLGAMPDASEAQLIRHCRRVADIIPLFGFYLQPAVGGRSLGWRFWRELADIPGVVAIKIAPFNRYATLDVVRAVSESGRSDIALYTGNDDAIVSDLVTPFRSTVRRRTAERRIVGGLLGQWAVWTRRAVELLNRAKQARRTVPMRLIADGASLTDANSAIFDARHGFAGCIPGIHEVLRRQGLLRGTWCLDPQERLSPGQSAEIDRVLRAYPHLTDDDFVRDRLDRWLAG
ncbi:MAG TPA: dihydrodipicolinate synthase family protein [Gemmatimonadaceae bacterium]|nr:dihydrodipicolinate synthase family protein [Gemmatimonadaceae bacterium]